MAEVWALDGAAPSVSTEEAASPPASPSLAPADASAQR
jgi:hypothetical protein